MKKIFSLTLLALIASNVFSQVQSGYIKTIGRPGKPGHALSQVEVRIKGDVNPLLSDDNGHFSFNISRINNSNSFIISSVRKKGYVIADNDVTNRINPFSETIPTVVVMISRAELAEDTRAIEEKTRQAVQDTYEKRLKELDSNLKDAVLNEEHYKQELAALMDWYDNIDNLVEKMAEYYARVDYDLLTDDDAEINRCIELGQLDRADSLIDSRGKISERLSAAKQQISQGKKMQTTGQEIEQDGLTKLHSAQQDAEHKYNIAIARFDNVTALEMLTQLAASDTLNSDYKLRVADFYRKNVINYQLAEANYKQAVSIANANKDTIQIVACLNNYGILLDEMGRYKEALETLNYALELRKSYSEEFTHGLASIYINKSSALDNLNETDEARRTYYELLSLIDKSDFKEDEDMQEVRHTVLHNLAGILAVEGKMDEAEKLMLENLSIASEHYGRNSRFAFSVYNGLGWLYETTKRYEKALEMYLEAMDIVKTMYGYDHIDMALIYSNLSSTYSSLGKNEQALSYGEKALDLRRKLLGNMHPDVAVSLHNLGTFYIEEEKYAQSIPYLTEAAEIREKMLHKYSSSTASTYQHLAIAYSQQDNPDYVKAIECGNRACTIYEKAETHKFNLFLTKFSVAQYQLAIRDYDAAIQTGEQLKEKAPLLVGSDSHHIIAVYALLRKIYLGKGDLGDALEMSIYEFKQQAKCNYSDKNALMNKYGNIVSIYRMSKKNSIDVDVVETKLNYFLKSITPTMTVVSPDSPAGQVGLSGTYDVLQYNDWDFIDNPIEFFEYMQSQISEPKDIVVVRDGQFYAHRFEDKMGTMMVVRFITAEERDALTKAYKKYKRKM